MLTYEIVKHIFQNLGIVADGAVGVQISLKSQNFKLDKTINIETDTEEYQNGMWSAFVTIEDHKMKFLLADISTQEKEYCLVVNLDGQPFYACYLNFTNPEGNIAILNEFPPEADRKTHWANCPVLIQANFLSAMEQVKLIAEPWSKFEGYVDMYDKMLSFINFQDMTA